MTTTEQYNELKKKYPKHIVLMRIGDFYETYDEDARKCNELCGLTLTQRNGKAQVLTGFPYHARQCHLTKLCNAGYKVTVCDPDHICVFESGFDGCITFTEHKLNNNNNPKTTTIMEKNFAAIRVKNVYWFNTEHEALIKLVIRYSKFNLDTHKASHEWAEAGSDGSKIVLTTTYNPQEPEKLPRFYASKEDFEKGKTMTADELYYMDNEQGICVPLLNNRKCRHIDRDDEQGCFIWAYVKGQAVKWYFNKHVEEVTFKYVDGCFTYATADADIPENYWNAGDVYQYNDWVEMTADGERIVHEASHKHLLLEPDQEELVTKLQGVIDECMAAGIKIYFSQNSYDLNAMNVRHIERLEYDPAYDEETEVAYSFDDSRVSRVLKGVYDINTEGGEVKFVIKK